MFASQLAYRAIPQVSHLFPQNSDLLERQPGRGIHVRREFARCHLGVELFRTFLPQFDPPPLVEAIYSRNRGVGFE